MAVIAIDMTIPIMNVIKMPAQIGAVKKPVQSWASPNLSARFIQGCTWKPPRSTNSVLSFFARNSKFEEHVNDVFIGALGCLPTTGRSMVRSLRSKSWISAAVRNQWLPRWSKLNFTLIWKVFRFFGLVAYCSWGLSYLFLVLNEVDVQLEGRLFLFSALLHCNCSVNI